MLKAILTFLIVVAMSVLIFAAFARIAAYVVRSLRRQGMAFALIGAGFLVSMAEKPGPEPESEPEPGVTRYVDVATGSDTNSGEDAEHPFKSIANALARVGDGGTILVAEGIYKEGCSGSGDEKRPNLTVTDGRHLTIRATGARDATIIDAEGECGCLWLNADQAINTNVVVEGFTLRNGNGSSLKDVGKGGGGAFGGWLKNCRIVSCAAQCGGGAWWAKLEDCTVEGCFAQYEGAGLNACEADRCRIVGNVISDCIGSVSGAGVCGGTTANSLIACNLIDATCTGEGYGAGAANNAKLINCTVSANTNNAATPHGGGLDNRGNGGTSREHQYNTIIYGNIARGEASDLYINGGDYDSHFTNCCTNDPSFKNAAAGDFSLGPTSVCRNAGDDAAVVGTLDCAGAARIQEENVDIGAFEYTPTLSTYTLHFDGNGNKTGTAPADKTLSSVEECTLPEPGMTCGCARFLGWATNATTAALYSPGEKVRCLASEPGGTITLYAAWEDVFIVNFDMNAANVLGGHRSYTNATGTGFCISACDGNADVADFGSHDAPCRVGWVLDNWNMSRDGTGTKICEQKNMEWVDSSTFGARRGDTVTLHAQWKESAWSMYWADPQLLDGKWLINVKGDAYAELGGVGEATLPTNLTLPQTYGGRTVSSYTASLVSSIVSNSVRSITIPEGCTNICTYAFCNACSLESIVFPSTLKTIPSCCCYNCTNLVSVTFAEGNEIIGQSAFGACKRIPSVAMPDGLANMDDCAFSDCTGLTRCVLAGDYVGSTCAQRQFMDCPIAKLEIPSSCVGFGTNALNQTKALRFLGDRPTWDVYNANRGAATLIEFPATNATWHAGKISRYGEVSHRGFVGPIAAFGVTDAYFWTNADENVTFAYAESPLAETITIPAGTISWGGVDWEIAGFEPDAFAGQATTTIYYPIAEYAKWETVTPPTGITLAPIPDACFTLNFHTNGGDAYEPAAMTFPQNAARTLPTANPTREGWTFGGWTNAVNDRVYQAGDAFVEDCTKVSTFTLYASWNEATVGNLAYTDDGGTVWAYDRTGDNVTIKDVVPGADVETLELPESIMGSTVVQKANGFNLPEKINGLWWDYVISDGTVKISGCSGTVPANLVIPARLGGKEVVGFQCQELFDNVETLVSVELPQTMTSVCRCQFDRCPNLETLVLNEGLQYITESFRSCPKLKEVELPSSLKPTNMLGESFLNSGTADRDFDTNGLLYADTDHTYANALDPSLTTVVVPDGVLACCSGLFQRNKTMTSCRLPEGLELSANMFHMSTLTEVSLPGGVTWTGTCDCGTTTITNALVRSAPPTWDLGKYFTGLKTITYHASCSADWAAYKTAHPSYTYVEIPVECVEATVGSYLRLDLEKDLGIETPDDVDYTAGDKVAIKIEGLAKGLKLVTSQQKAKIGKKTVVTNVVYTIEGTPREAVDFETQTMFARITTTYKDKTKGKIESLVPLRLQIDAATPVKSNDGFLGAIDWEVRNSAVTVMQGVIQTNWYVMVDADAKVSASGLPTGLKLAQDKKTKGWALSGTPTKAGNFVVTFKTVQNGVTRTERIAMVVEANAYTGNWHAMPEGECDVSWTASVSVAAGGTVKLALAEGTTNTNAKGVVQSQVTKTTVTAKSFDGDGKSAVFTLPKNKKVAGSADRPCVVDFEARTIRINGGAQCADLGYQKPLDFEVPEVATMVLEEFVECEDGNTTNAFACLTATYSAAKGLVGVRGKLCDGTAVKATTYALADANGGTAPFLVTDKSKNSISFTILYSRTSEAFNRMQCSAIVNGKFMRISERWSCPFWDGFGSADAKLLKSTRFSDMTAATNLVVLVDAATSPRQAAITLPIPAKSLATKLTAQGLVTFKNLKDEGGVSWTCELLPVGEMPEDPEVDTPFRGIATGTKKGFDALLCPVWSK